MSNKRVWPVLLRLSFGISFPPLVVLTLFRLLSAFFNVQVPLWIVISSALLSTPVTIVGRGHLSQLRYRRAAAAAGAVLPPIFQGKWPGNVDIIMALLDNFHNRYPGNLVFVVLTLHCRV